LRVAGQRLTGDFALEKTTSTGPDHVLGNGDDVTSVRVGVANLSIGLGDGTTDFVTVTNGEGSFLLTAAGMAGQIGGTVNVNVPGVAVTGTLKLSINNTNAAVQDSFQVGATTIAINLPIGPYVRVDGTGLSATISGLAVSGDFAFERLTKPDGQRVVRVAVSNGAVALGDAASPLVRVTAASGRLLVSSAGVAGEISGSLSLNFAPVVTFTGNIVAAFNTTANAVSEDFTVGSETVRLDLPAGPYTRVEVRGTDATHPATLKVLGQSLSGNFAFEQITNTAGQRRVRLAASSVSLSLGGIVSVTNGQGMLLVNNDGLAGSFSANVALTLPAGISLSGDFAIAINQTGRSINESLNIGGQTVTLTAPAGPYLRVEARGARLSLLVKP